jgi:hypothetical protein
VIIVLLLLLLIVLLLLATIYALLSIQHVFVLTTRICDSGRMGGTWGENSGRLAGT